MMDELLIGTQVYVGSQGRSGVGAVARPERQQGARGVPCAAAPFNNAAAAAARKASMSKQPRDPVPPTHFGDFNDNPAFEGPSDTGGPWAEKPVVFGWVGHWYDPILRFVLCRLFRVHRWLYCSAYVSHVPNALPGDGLQEWWQCARCNQQAVAGPWQPKTPWPRGDQ